MPILPCILIINRLFLKETQLLELFVWYEDVFCKKTYLHDVS